MLTDDMSFSAPAKSSMEEQITYVNMWILYDKIIYQQVFVDTIRNSFIGSYSVVTEYVLSIISIDH